MKSTRELYILREKVLTYSNLTSPLRNGWEQDVKWMRKENRAECTRCFSCVGHTYIFLFSFQLQIECNVHHFIHNRWLCIIYSHMDIISLKIYWNRKIGKHNMVYMLNSVSANANYVVRCSLQGISYHCLTG